MFGRIRVLIWTLTSSGIGLRGVSTGVGASSVSESIPGNFLWSGTGKCTCCRPDTWRRTAWEWLVCYRLKLDFFGAASWRNLEDPAASLKDPAITYFLFFVERGGLLAFGF